ncbi:tRNA (adenosine(37)-N6)-dimethylallyltransferase MiaA [soil metagenome]
MATNSLDLPLVVIVGPTASGKSSLAVDIAKRFNGEIICADSRTVYKDMDIATAKPSMTERGGIPHFGVDLVAPGVRFTVANFKQYADQMISDIQNRGHVPILVGGTGLYIDAVLFDYQFGTPNNEKLRYELQQKSLEELHLYCHEHRINLPENHKNKRYVIRSIENAETSIDKKNEPVYKNIIVGITTDKIELNKRIASRIEQQLENGVVNEAISLGKKYGWEHESMKANMYPLIHEYVDGNITMDQLTFKIESADRRLAKRQITWFKRNKFIHWMTLDEANTYLSDYLVVTE